MHTIHSWKTALALLVIGLSPLTGARAGLDAVGQQEVQALLTFVGNSHCTFIRNGSSYSAQDAKAHLQGKLDYLTHRGMVDSAEQFIARAGSVSSIIGKPYRVNCDGVEQTSADWLNAELTHLRKAAH